MLPVLVRAHARAHPTRTAVVAGPERLTYAQLDARTSRLVHRLRAAGVARGALVGVHLDRTSDVVVGLLAVLGVGAAYTVVEPTTPVAEGAGRLALAGPDLVLTSLRYQDALVRQGLRTLVVDQASVAGEAELEPGAGDDVAYVLYTSGSTGVPKGVMVSRTNVQHYTEALLARLEITQPLSYAHVTTLAADLGNTCLFLALWTGGTLHLVDDATRRDPRGLLRYLGSEGVDVLKTTPSHWGVVFRAFGRDAQTTIGLRFLLLGGELLPLALARRILTSQVTRTLVNHYGPTEATVGVAVQVLSDESELDALGDAVSVPIGTAFGETRLLVRTEDGLFYERGVVGELYISGPSVTLGYRGDAEATAAAFGPGLGGDPLRPGRAYRTGDQVRADAQGVLEFLGRGDRQVKIRGYRVELGHVEAGLRRLPAVTDAVAIHLPRERSLLVGGVVVGEFGADPAALRSELREVLPAHLIPDRIEVFDAFPRNGNGKVDHRALGGLVEERIAARAQRVDDHADPLFTEVCEVWQRHLGHGEFGPHDDFARVGGSSIDAIQVIADLQAKGHPVSAAEFLAEPTVVALVARLRSGRAPADSRPGTAPPPAAPLGDSAADDSALTPAQEWFFRQDFAQPDQWNQALLLDLDADVVPTHLAAAVDDVLRLHPMLHTAFRSADGAVRREVVAVPEVFTTSVLPSDGDLVDRHIAAVAAARQAEIAPADGQLVRAHLFLGTGQPAHLLLICHHLSIDAVSWRVVTNDLSRCYTARLRGGEPKLVPARTDFGTWATHLRQQAATLRRDLGHWDGLTHFPASAPDTQGHNRERDTQTVWFGLTRTETDTLVRPATPGTELSAHAALLGAFSQALAGDRGTDQLVVDVESHGRTALGDAWDVSRVVGWFTSTFPVLIGTVTGDVTVTAKAAAAALAEVPRLGVAYGLHAQPQRSDVCFNYLGSLSLPYGDDLRMAPSRRPVGPVRGPDNDRGYALKLTARLHGGQLVADLSYSPHQHDPQRVLALARATRAHLLRIAGAPESDGQFVVESGSSTGLLLQVPRALHCEPPSGLRREYGTVLLTGATGFIGAHLLHLLLTRTTAQVICLVRDRPGHPGAERLRGAYADYLPADELDRYADRVQVLTGDVSQPGFGLPAGDEERLCRDVEAIYHLAADTRLFGDRETFERHNTEPVRALIRLAGSGRPKDLHHVSTLAVCGSGTAGEPVLFTEDSLDVSQRFLNEYERSKYEAERLVLEFTANGGAGYVYRTGNVTGHSVTGRFQRNAGDSRLVQLLRAVVRVGQVPRVGSRPLVLSPVDVVAAGILEISRSPRVRSGTFHVESTHQVSYGEVFQALRELGCTLEDTAAPDFTALFRRHLGQGDRQLSLAHFWASRPARNVRYDHTRTRRLLADLGVEFPALDHTWLHDYFAGLIQSGEIPLADNTGSST